MAYNNELGYTEDGIRGIQTIDELPLLFKVYQYAAIADFPALSYFHQGNTYGIPDSEVAWKNTCRRLKNDEVSLHLILTKIREKAMLLKKKEFELLPTGDYLAVVTSYEEAKAAKPEYGPSIKVEFEVRADDEVTAISCFVPTGSFTKRSKLASLVMACMGYDDWSDVPDDFDIDDIIQRKLVLELCSKTVDGVEYNRINAFKPCKKSSKAKAQAAKPKPSAFDDDDE